MICVIAAGIYLRHCSQYILAILEWLVMQKCCEYVWTNHHNQETPWKHPPVTLDHDKKERNECVDKFLTITVQG